MRTANDKQRPLDHCTGCGKRLPETRRGWGLVWDDGSGFCAKCLYDIRVKIGYFERIDKTYAPKRRKDYK